MRRVLQATAIALALSLGTAGCTGGVIDPVKVTEGIKTTCGILVVGAALTTLVNAGIGLSVQALVDAVCSAYKAQAAAGNLTAPAPNSTIRLPVTINGKPITIEATVQ